MNRLAHFLASVSLVFHAVSASPRDCTAAEVNAELPSAFALHAYVAWRDGDTNRLTELSADVRKQLAATNAADATEQRRWLRFLIFLDARRGTETNAVVGWLERYHDLHGAAEVFDRRMFQSTFYAVPEGVRQEFWGRLYRAGKLRELDYDFAVLNDTERALRSTMNKEGFEKFRATKDKWLRENPGKWYRPDAPSVGESASRVKAREAAAAKMRVQMEELAKKAIERQGLLAKYTPLKDLAAARKHREALDYANGLKAEDVGPGLWENVLYDRCVIAHRLYWQQRQNPEVAKERDGYYEEYLKLYGNSPRRTALESILKLVNFQ